MKRDLSKKEKVFYKKIARILWKDWDPLGAYNEKDEWDDEYDGYVPSIFRLAIEDRDVYKISNHLTELQTISMGMSTALGNEHDKNIAELIIKTKQEIIDNV
jgi:hypothetical protein